MPRSDFWDTPTYKIVRMMKANGNADGLIVQWKKACAIWLASNPKASPSDIQAMKLWLPLWKVRPFYTASEIAQMIPTLAVILGLCAVRPSVHGTARTINELKLAGLSSVGIFRHPETGRQELFFPMERISFWTKNPPQSQEEFDYAIYN